MVDDCFDESQVVMQAANERASIPPVGILRFHYLLVLPCLSDEKEELSFLILSVVFVRVVVAAAAHWTLSCKCVSHNSFLVVTDRQS